MTRGLHVGLRARDRAQVDAFRHAGRRRSATRTTARRGRARSHGPTYSFSLVRDERPLTQHVHLAFPAREDAAVRAFHAAALAAGYADAARGPGATPDVTRLAVVPE